MNSKNIVIKCNGVVLTKGKSIRMYAKNGMMDVAVNTKQVTLPQAKRDSFSFMKESDMSEFVDYLYGGAFSSANAISFHCLHYH